MSDHHTGEHTRDTDTANHTDTATDRGDESGRRPLRAVGRTLMWHQRDLGLVEEVVEVGDHGFFLVDTRHWTYGAKRLVPCGSVTSSSRSSTATSEVDDLTIRSAPDFDPFQLGQRRYQDDLARHYRLEPSN